MLELRKFVEEEIDDEEKKKGAIENLKNALQSTQATHNSDV